jgi:hypothetical protein
VQEGDILVGPRNRLSPAEHRRLSARSSASHNQWPDTRPGEWPADTTGRHHSGRQWAGSQGRARSPRRPLFRRLYVVIASGLAALLAALAVVALREAGAASASPFVVVDGSIQPATGIPTPPSGTHAALWKNTSSATTTLDGSGRVVLGAIADYCQGWPTVRVVVDGQRVGDTTIVSTTYYGSYPVGVAVGAGTHKVTISFINDLYLTTCDRNVYVGFAQMETPSATTSPAPSAPAAPTGRPGPDNTGVPDGTSLTVHEGDLTITQDGTVIDSLDIRGYLKIQANNVIVRRSIIRGGYAPGPTAMSLVSAYGSHVNFIIEDSTLLAAHPSGYQDGLKGRNFTARRLDISNVVDTVQTFGDNVTLTDSWLHGTTYYTPFPAVWDNQTHNDTLQIEGGTNIVVRGNRMEGAHNAAIMVTQNYSRTSNVQVDRNWLSGGGCTVNLSEKGKGPILGFYLRNNFFGPSFGLGNLDQCAVIAPPTSQVIMENNVYESTGVPVVLQRGA